MPGISDDDRPIRGGSVSHTVEQDEHYWTEERLADMKVKKVAAKRLAPELVGLSAEQAQLLVDKHPDLHVRFVSGKYPASYGYGRITAVTRDDIVVEASDG